MLAPIRIMQEVNHLHQQWYPRAALFGATFALKLAPLAQAQDTPVFPALAVIQQMLNRDSTEGDFQLALRQHLIEGTGLQAVDTLEVQGYVDFVALAWAAISAAMRDVESEQIVGTLEQWQQFNCLSPYMQLRSKQFVITHARWAGRNLWLHNVQELHTFIDHLLIHIEQQSLAPTYRTGLETAHDTMLLYLDLLYWWRAQEGK